MYQSRYNRLAQLSISGAQRSKYILFSGHNDAFMSDTPRPRLVKVSKLDFSYILLSPGKKKKKKNIIAWNKVTLERFDQALTYNGRDSPNCTMIPGQFDLDQQLSNAPDDNHGLSSEAGDHLLFVYGRSGIIQSTVSINNRLLTCGSAASSS